MKAARNPGTFIEMLNTKTRVPAAFHRWNDKFTKLTIHSHCSNTYKIIVLYNFFQKDIQRNKICKYVYHSYYMFVYLFANISLTFKRFFWFGVRNGSNSYIGSFIPALRESKDKHFKEVLFFLFCYFLFCWTPYSQSNKRDS